MNICQVSNTYDQLLHVNNFNYYNSIFYFMFYTLRTGLLSWLCKRQISKLDAQKCFYRQSNGSIALNKGQCVQLGTSESLFVVYFVAVIMCCVL